MSEIEERYETYAYLWVREFDPPHSQISDLLGLEPTEAFVEGDPWIKDRKRPFSSWHLKSPLPRTEIFLDAHIEALFDILEPKRDRLAEVAAKYEVGMNCVGYYYSAHPGFHLSAEVVRRCADLNLSMDFDLYCMR